MNLLIGLPLKIFALLFALLRIALPVLVILLVVWLMRRLRAGQNSRGTSAGGAEAKEPTFNGPVYTVDYEEVDDSEEKP